VGQDLPGNALVVDESDEPHRPGAPGANQNVDREGPLEELGPVKSALSRRVVGTLRLREVGEHRA